MVLLPRHSIPILFFLNRDTPGLRLSFAYSPVHVSYKKWAAVHFFDWVDSPVDLNCPFRGIDWETEKYCQV